MALFIQTELREKKYVIVDIDGAKSEREMALPIQTELREEKKCYS